MRDVLGLGTGDHRPDDRRAGEELVAGIDVPHAVLLERQRVHRFERRMDVDAGQVFDVDDFGRLFHRRGGVAVFDEQEAFLAFFLQPAGTRR